MKKIAINGFGRIGRLVFRQLVEDKTLDIVAINDLTDAKTLAHLLKYDSAQGKFKGTVEVKGDAIVINGKTVKIYAERDPKNLPWKELGIDAVVESTGFFRTQEGAGKHLEAGAKKVVISAPASGDIKTIVYSVNEDELDAKDTIISGASCTTNCLAPIAKILEDTFGIVKGLMTTIHAYTADQKIVDAPHSDLRRARAGAANIVPTSTGAAVAVSKVIPSLKGKLDGIAMRVPVLTGSVVDLVVELGEGASVDKINAAMKKNASSSLQYNMDQIVSSDVVGSEFGSIFDSTLTSEIQGGDTKLFKIVAWYDNENSYVSQFVRTFKHFITL